MPGTRRMEVRSQISFRRGRTSFYPSSAGLSLPAAWISFPVITALFVFLLGTRFGCPIGFQRRHHRPPRRKGLQTIVRVPRRVLFSTFSLRAPPSPFQSHFHAKLAIFTLSPRRIRNFVIGPRFHLFKFFIEISAFGSMNGGEFSPATTTFLGKSFFFVSGIATKELFVTCVTRFRVFAA